jgi:hypothetical protein
MVDLSSLPNLHRIAGGSSKLTSKNKRSQTTRKKTKQQSKRNQVTHMGARSQRYLIVEELSSN